MSKREISNSDDIVDSRDIIKRIDDLESLRDDWQANHDLPDYVDVSESLAPESWNDEQTDKWIEWEESEDGEELTALKALQDECEGYSDWRYGESLIRDSYMDESWAEQELKDLGYLLDDLPNLISSNINWKGVLEDLQQDYTEVDWDGVKYWMRS